MKKLFSIIFVFLFCTFAFAEIITIRVNTEDAGFQTLKVHDRYILEECKFIFQDSGDLKFIMTYSRINRDGYWLNWNLTGQMQIPSYYTLYHFQEEFGKPVVYADISISVEGDHIVLIPYGELQWQANHIVVLKRKIYFIAE